MQQCMGDKMIPVEYLVDCFDADFDAGVLRWRTRPDAHFASARTAKLWNARFAGKVAGGPHKEGYIAVTLVWGGRRRIVLAHRVLWCMANGRWPAQTIDHADLCRSNNRLANLREATYGQQNANRRATRRGLKGATFDKRTGLYLAQITSLGKNKFLGRYRSEEEAHAAYIKAANLHHGEFART